MNIERLLAEVLASLAYSELADAVAKVEGIAMQEVLDFIHKHLYHDDEKSEEAKK